MIVGIIVGIVAVAVIVGFVFVNQPSFGRAPQGERLERIKKSPHYKDGEFRNLHSTMMMTSQRDVWELSGDSCLSKKPIYVLKRDSGYKDGPQQDKQGRECIGMVRTFILFYPDRRKAYTGRPRILWGFSGFVCKQAVQGGGCLQACRYAGD